MADIKKQIKDYDAVTSLATTDNIITQQAGDSICRRTNPKQIMDLYASAFAQTMMLLSNKAAWKSALDYLDIAQKSDAELGTANTTMMTPLATAYSIEGYVPKYTSIASATTTSLATVTQRYINVTGTTDITSFGTATNGTYKYLKFTGSSLKITQGASLVTVDGVDIKTQINDTAEVSCGASNVWTVVKYTRANGLPLLHEELIATIEHKETQNTAGGTLTSGSFNTRPLNTIVYNKYGTDTVTIASNQFVITPTGTQKFIIKWWSAAFRVNAHQSQLYDITGAANVKYGSTGNSNQTYGGNDRSSGVALVTLSAENTYEIRHRPNQTQTTNGFGNVANFGDEIYACVEIYRVRQ